MRNIFAVSLVFLFANVSQATVENCPDGALVSGLKKGSVYDRLGLKNGDCMKSVNGKPVQSGKDLEKMARNISSLPSSIEVEIVRDGKPQTLKYKIK